MVLFYSRYTRYSYSTYSKFELSISNYSSSLKFAFYCTLVFFFLRLKPKKNNGCSETPIDKGTT